MTCIQWMESHHPEYISVFYKGGCLGCPHTYIGGTASVCNGNPQGITHENCTKCWYQEIPENLKGEDKMSKIRRIIREAVEEKVREELTQDYIADLVGEIIEDIDISDEIEEAAKEIIRDNVGEAISEEIADYVPDVVRDVIDEALN